MRRGEPDSNQSLIYMALGRSQELFFHCCQQYKCFNRTVLCVRLLNMNQRDRQREETKRRIYDCAFRLFVEKGFQNVKVTDIAKAAGSSIGGLYHHDKSKEEIIDYGYRTFDDMLEEYYEKQTVVSPAEGIRTLIRFQMDTCVAYGVKIISITFRNQINAENRYRYWEGRYIWTKLLENLSAAGVPEGEVKTAARYILRTSRGCVYDWCCKNGDFDLTKEAVIQVDMILEHYHI